jgi:hypothetical protein
VTETYKLVNIRHGIDGLEPLKPKNGARYHFSLPGSVQGFEAETTPESKDAATVENVVGHSSSGEHALAIHYHRLAIGRIARVAALTFIPSKATATYFDQRGYRLLASPSLYPGQTVQAHLSADAGNIESAMLRLYARQYNEDDSLTIIGGEPVQITPGASLELSWTVPDTGGYPIAYIGIEITGEKGNSGSVYLDDLTWDGTPNITLNRPILSEAGREKHKNPIFWKKAWIHALDTDERLNHRDYWTESYRLIQNEGRGLLIQGTRDWTDYQFMASAMPRICEVGGIAVRVQGMKRYSALLLDQEKARLVRVLDGETILAETDHGWTFERNYDLKLQVAGNKLTGFINGEKVLEAQDPDHALQGGGVALINQVGFIYYDNVAVRPI